MSELSKILTEANTEKWSLRDIENQAARNGHKLNFTTAGKYLNGTHGKPTAEVLNAFADVFRLDVNQLRAASGLQSTGEPFILPAEAAQLTGPEREAIKHLVRVMVESKRERAEPDLIARGPDGSLLVEAKTWTEPGSTALPANYYELAAHPKVDSPSMREHAAGERRGEESQEHPED